MNRYLRHTLFGFLLSLAAHAGGIPELMTLEEFSKLAGDLAPKVNLFLAIWDKDPNAELFGGTSRDFLYWVKGELRGATTRAEIEARMAKLRALKIIDVREFITSLSDVDVMTDKSLSAITAEDYGVRKVDVMNKNRLDPLTDEGRTERAQGFIPVEKIRLGRNGVVPWKALGDGLRELFDGNLTVTYAARADFDRTHYATIGQNHPSFLALRYLRLLATHYYYEHGKGKPDREVLFQIDPASAEATKRIFAESLRDKTLRTLIKEPQFAGRLNGTVHKAFRTYTNPDAALALFQHFGAQALVEAFGQIETTSQYLFVKERDPAAIEKNLAALKVDRAKFFEPPEKTFPDGTLYHGTPTSESFRAILLGGVLPSKAGTADGGLYGVSLRNLALSENVYAGRKEGLVRFPIRPGTTIVDITKGEGARVFKAFGGSADAFADAFGVDILRYPYSSEAYVVKNSDALGKPFGHSRQILTVGKLLELAEHAKSEKDFLAFSETIHLNGLTTREHRLIVGETPYFKAALAGVRSAETLAAFLTVMETSRVPIGEFLSPVREQAPLSIFGEGVDFAIEEHTPIDYAFLRFLASVEMVKEHPDDETETKILETRFDQVLRGGYPSEVARLITEITTREDLRAVHAVMRAVTERRLAEVKNAQTVPGPLKKISRHLGLYLSEHHGEIYRVWFKYLSHTIGGAYLAYGSGQWSAAAAYAALNLQTYWKKARLYMKDREAENELKTSDQLAEAEAHEILTRVSPPPRELEVEEATLALAGQIPTFQPATKTLRAVEHLATALDVLADRELRGIASSDPDTIALERRAAASFRRLDEDDADKLKHHFKWTYDRMMTPSPIGKQTLGGIAAFTATRKEGEIMRRYLRGFIDERLRHAQARLRAERRDAWLRPLNSLVYFPGFGAALGAYAGHPVPTTAIGGIIGLYSWLHRANLGAEGDRWEVVKGHEKRNVGRLKALVNIIDGKECGEAIRQMEGGGAPQ